VTRSLIANMILFVYISNFLIKKYFSTQGEDIVEHTNGKSHVSKF
jgi:hypothetical protein